MVCLCFQAAHKISKLIPLNGDVYVVYVNGFTELISSAMQNSNALRPRLLPGDENIVDVLIKDSTVIVSTCNQVSLKCILVQQFF